MLVVETVAKIRRDHDRGKPIKAIARETGLSRNTVRKAVRAESAQFSYRGQFRLSVESYVKGWRARGCRDRADFRWDRHSGRASPV
jgi:predicted transcriptional regulator